MLLLFILVLLVICSVQRDKLKKISYENNKMVDVINLYKEQTKILEEMLEKVEKENIERMNELNKLNTKLTMQNKDLSMKYLKEKQARLKK